MSTDRPSGGSSRVAAGSVAVLASGGLDSAILVCDLLRTGRRVAPLFLRQGLHWEGAELDHLRRFLGAVAAPELAALTVLDCPVADLLPGFWATTGRGAPDADSPDEAVFLPGRNVLLLAKGMLWCHLNQVPALALGTLRSNPFPDATERFFSTFARAVNEGLGSDVAVLRPFGERSKGEVLELGRGLPLELSFSCIQPVGGRHCGRCNKCAERRRAFAGLGRPDPTPYDDAGPGA